MICDRPTGIEDRGLPGTFGGDLVIGSGPKPAVGALIEGKMRFVMLPRLPDCRKAESAREALTRRITKSPTTLRRTLTWAQVYQMAEHTRSTIGSKLNAACEQNWRSADLNHQCRLRSSTKLPFFQALRKISR
jgi:transposase, IS30 family